MNCFINIPKTGSSSISKHFNIPNKHIKAKNIKGTNIQIYTVMRNPFDRFLSAFYHHKNMNPEHLYYEYDKDTKINQYRDPNHFIKCITEGNSEALVEFNKYVHFEPQINYLVDSNGQLDTRIKKIYKYEDFFENRKFLPLVNKGDYDRNYKFNRNSIEFIRNYYSEDFKLMLLLNENGIASNEVLSSDSDN